MSTALAYTQPEPSYDPVAIGASRKFWASLTRQFGPRTAVERMSVEEWTQPQIVARFWAKVARLSDIDCWPWIGAINSGGYGNFSANKVHIRASRYSWTLANGQHIAHGQFICHRCDNRARVNPMHLFVGSHSDNMVDMVAKGRGRQNYARAEVCKRGHPLTGYNNLPKLDKRSGLTHASCRECANEARRKRASASAAARRGDWSKDPEAQSILASIRVNPPKCEAVAVQCLGREFAGKPAIRFTGRRVARLEAICDRVFADVYREAYPEVGTGDRRALDVWSKVGLPVDVIEAELGL